MPPPNHPQPPLWLLRFFRWFCHPDYREDVEGDLQERFEGNVAAKGVKAARWLFFRDVVQLFRPNLIQPQFINLQLDHYGMFKSYLTITYRHLLKNKAFSLINVVGLAIGMAACLLILQYVQFELSYDEFHENSTQTYRVVADYHTEVVRETTLTPPPLGPLLQESYSEVIDATRLILPWSGQAATSTLSGRDPAGKQVKQSFRWGFFTDPGFLKMFSFPLICGNPQKALTGTHKIVLSERAVRKLFGNTASNYEQIIGQRLEYINEYDRFSLTISGIIADAPANSHFQYDFLTSFATLSTGWAKDHAETWNGNSVYTYLQLTPNTDLATFHPKISEVIALHGTPELQENVDFKLQPLTDIYLHSHREEELKMNGNALYIYFFSIIAGLILLIALVNYINLTIAKAITRGDEIGLRKVMGARRFQLIGQFLFEALLINTVALALALTVLQLVSSSAVNFTGRAIHYSVRFWIVTGLLYMLSTLLAGLYPALVLSRFHPLRLLKGKWYSPRGKKLRKGMVVFQFGVSIMLIIFTFAIIQQLQYMRSSDPGFNREGIIVAKGPENRAKTWIEHDQQKLSKSQEDVFKDAVLPYVGVNAVSLSRTTPGERSSIFPTKLGATYNHSTLDALKADSDYAEVYGLKLLAGQFNTDNGLVINEQAAKILGYDNPAEAVGQTFRDARNYKYTINGVIQDYHHHSLQYEPRPLTFSQDDFTYKLDSYYSIKLAANNLENTIEQIAETYQRVFPYDTFEFYFIDSFFDAQYQKDIRFGKLFGVFSGLAILIASMGLFGLSLHTVVEKTKEIGIRKVLGASVRSITALLSQDFIRLIVAASIIALPITYFALQMWLANYATRIGLHWWLFLLPLAVVILIALITVSFHTVKAALVNPADSLRYE